MPKLHPIAALIVCSTLLPACMAPAPTPQTRPQLTVKPHSEVRNTPGATVDYYVLGKNYQATGRMGLAMEAYIKALTLNRQHVEARNALATLYSQQGRFAEAEATLREVIAQNSGAAYLHNNLGYIYFLQENDVAAIREFRTALSLDPDHEWARNNLKLAQAMLERRMAANTEPSPRRAETTVKAFEVWDEFKGRAAKLESLLDNALGTVPEVAKPSTPTAALRADVVAQVLNWRTARKPEPEVLSNAVSQPKPRLTVQLAKMERSIDARTPDVVAAVTEKFRLEISNGNGVTGFAKRVSQILVRQGIPVLSLTNQLPFQQLTTEIQYQDGFEQQAEQLKNTLRGYAIVARTSKPPRDWFDLRVVLGKDITLRIAEIETEKPEHVAASKSASERL